MSEVSASWALDREESDLRLPAGEEAAAARRLGVDRVDRGLDILDALSLVEVNQAM